MYNQKFPCSQQSDKTGSSIFCEVIVNHWATRDTRPVSPINFSIVHQLPVRTDDDFHMFYVKQLNPFFFSNNSWWVWSCTALGWIVDLACSMTYLYFLEYFPAKKACIWFLTTIWKVMYARICVWSRGKLSGAHHQTTIGPTAALTLNGWKSDGRWI